MVYTIGSLISLLVLISIILIPIWNLLDKETIFKMNYFQYSLLVVIPLTMIQMVYMGVVTYYHFFTFK